MNNKIREFFNGLSAKRGGGFMTPGQRQQNQMNQAAKKASGKSSRKAFIAACIVAAVLVFLFLGDAIMPGGLFTFGGGSGDTFYESSDDNGESGESKGVMGKLADFWSSLFHDHDEDGAGTSGVAASNGTGKSSGYLLSNKTSENTGVDAREAVARNYKAANYGNNSGLSSFINALADKTGLSKEVLRTLLNGYLADGVLSDDEIAELAEKTGLSVSELKNLINKYGVNGANGSNGSNGAGGLNGFIKELADRSGLSESELKTLINEYLKDGVISEK
ncbi:MAG: homeobox domain-containing protein, partial [Lachnospiraceae bacterium]|nr:homeobox domain-containing protein [Lachnospiraceae bacterium]